MITRWVKYLSLAAVLAVVFFWDDAQEVSLGLRILLSIGSLLVALQAYRANKYPWLAVFALFFLVFNPFVEIFTATGNSQLMLLLSAGVFFAASLRSLKTHPLPSAPSITGSMNGRDSL